MTLKISLVIIWVGFLSIIASGQSYKMSLVFTAVSGNEHVSMDSIRVKNVARDCDTMLYWPDTVLSFIYTGAEVEQQEHSISGILAVPNPVRDQARIRIYVPEKDLVRIRISDLTGRSILKDEQTLERGVHFFRFQPGRSEFYIISMEWRGNTQAVKIISLSESPGRQCTLIYENRADEVSFIKSLDARQAFEFQPGDELVYTGYSDSLQSGLTDAPESSEDYIFQFASNISCPGTPTVKYDGHWYETIQIFSQCWLKENLKAGVMKSSMYGMTNNGILDKYCYDDNPAFCDQYGGLYTWDEAMQYSHEPGAQGICPPGWHIPSSEEWKLLEGAADSRFRFGDPEWYSPYSGWNGFDAGTNLKSNSGWMGGSGIDLLGFDAVAGGFADIVGDFYGKDAHGFWWGSTGFPGYAFVEHRHLSKDSASIQKDKEFRQSAFSVRCVRDMVYFETTELSFSAIMFDSLIHLDSIHVRNLTSGHLRMLYSPDTMLYSWEINLVPGDKILMIGYFGALESGRIDYPEGDQVYIFQFATNIPCVGIPAVEYHGKIYPTIQIYNQCWLAANLDVGEMVDGTENQSDNQILEKYCYLNSEDSCGKYGGLYQFGEMMQYTSMERIRGICPPGWIIPSDDDWKVLEAAADSLIGIGDLIWDNTGWRGQESGTNLKSSDGWKDGGNGSDLFGFAGFPAGYRGVSSLFKDAGKSAFWWSSTGSGAGTSWFRQLSAQQLQSRRYNYVSGYGMSVRCLKL